MKNRNKAVLIIGLLLPLTVVAVFAKTGSGVCSLYYDSAWNYIILGIITFVILGYYFRWFTGVKSNLKAVFFFLTLLVLSFLEILIIAVAVNFHCWTF
ncbi:MAG TPA: hypothetical protein VFH37_00605 [Candidatus Saccharimonadales bacterium]|nr:hypothetical protein [Candidatus Saccharimonadales bacterium]